jgi:gliding-associated putative ABC transporter substrate-binding component GldG
MMQINSKKNFIIYSFVLFAVLVLLNMISRNKFFRWDLTDNKMYSLSESSKSVVSKIDDLMTLKVYFSNNLPGEYGNNRRYLQDILEEYAAFSDGNLTFEFYEPETDEDLQTDAQKSGIQPVQLQVIENDKVEVKRVYMGLVFMYEDAREVIPVIQTTTGLEYDITTNIKKLVDSNKESIAIASTSTQTITNENIVQILRQRFNVRNIGLDSVVPTDIAVILLNGVSDSLSVEERKNLENYVENGGNLIVGQNRLTVDIQTQQATPIVSDIFQLLGKYGFQIEENLVLDKTCGQVNVQQNMGIFRMAVPMDYPFLPIIQNFNENEAVVSGLEGLRTMFPSEITLDSLNETMILFQSSDNSSSMSEFYNLNPDPKVNPIFSQLNEKGKILAARSEVSNNETGISGQVILISDSKFFADNGGGGSPENHIFMLNAIDFLLGDSELISLRSREITNRPLQELEDDIRMRWKWANILLPSLLIVVFGFVRLRGEKNRATMLEELYD